MEENQVQPPQPPVENHEIVKNEQKPSSGLKSKWPFLVIAMLLVLLGGAGTYIFLGQSKQSQNQTATPTPTTAQDQTGNPNLTPGEPKDDTADWQTYINGSLGYSLKYPKNWYSYSMKDYPYEGYPGVIDPNETIIASLNKFPKSSAGDGSGDVYIGFIISKLDQDIEEYVNRLKNSKEPNGQKSNSVEALILNGNKAYKITQLDRDVEWLIPNENGKGNIIISMSSNSSSNISISTINQILSTFTFAQ